MTPTEILRAWRLGAPLIKVYPSPSVGTDFFKNILAPLPFLKMIPSGGMTLQNAPEWIKAGAAAVSISNALMDPALIAKGAWGELTARARAFSGAVETARAELAGR
jgi:2-dehydro-3-deoxyphosphogluconate aldolase/(4S)-4-hydroxy-2-oxoglutarate aldolase